MKIRREIRRKAGLFGFAIILMSLPLAGYIGPGAGFAFLSSFLVLFLTFFLAVFSFLSWPFRFIWKAVRGQKAYKKSKADRVIILGLDGLEPGLAEKYMAEGKLPNLKRLRTEGTYARLRTTTPAISPVAWSSFMTGCEPSKHNIFDFLSRDPKTYLPDLSSARIGKAKRKLTLGKYEIPLSKPEIRGLRKSVPFWKILGDRGIFSTILRVPITFPPEKFAGHLLSGMCAPDLKGSQGTFSFYTTDPGKIEKREGGIAIPLPEDVDDIETYISGPENSLLKESSEIRLPMKIHLDRSKEEALVEVSGRKIRLKKQSFSPWIRVTFKPGLGMKVQSICRFYVIGFKPHFEMYITPLNIDPEKPALPISHPFIYSVYLAKLQGSFITLGEANDTWALNEGVLSEKAFLDLTYSNHAEWELMFFNAIRKTKKGMSVCVFETTDSIQHMFWRYLDKAHPALRSGQNGMSSAVIEDLYVRMDALVGKILDELGRRDILIVMSDHGFKSFSRGVNLNAWLHRNGYLALKEGREEGEEWFKNVDWNKTRAYALGLGGVYINQKGREAMGTVLPGAETKALKAELIRKLNGLRDGEKNKTAVNTVYDRDAIYAGPYRENAPDLIIGYNEGFRASWDSVTGKVTRTVFEDNPKAWSGDHCIDPECVPGVFFSSLKMKDIAPSIVDIAPTVLDLFGLAAPGHMDGRSLLPEASDAGLAKKQPGKKGTK